MKNLKVSKKLEVVFGAVFLLTALVVISSFSAITAVSNQLKDFYSGPFQNVIAAQELIKDLNNASKNMLHACVTKDSKETDSRLAMVSENFSAMNESLTFLSGNFRGSQEDINNTTEYIKQMENLFDDFRTLCQSNDIDGAFAVYRDQMAPLLNQVDESINNIKAFVDSTAINMHKKGETISRNSTIANVILGIAGIVIGITIASYIVRMLVGCINELKNASLKMAEGDFDVPLTYHSKDELGQLSHGMRIMTSNIKSVIEDENYLLAEISKGNFNIKTKAGDRYVGAFSGLLDSMRQLVIGLSDTLSQINQAADQVSTGSEQVSSGAQALSQGTTQQASSIEELAAAIDEISNQVNSNAKNAQDANKLAGQVGQNMTESNQQMQQMIEAMKEINDTSSEIGKIIKTIEDIAFQTNILALNAAVEAARAGAAGKGFAVVADEVRNLAGKSAEASQNTAALIESSIHAVNKGTGIADRTAQALMESVEGAQQVITVIDAISQASNEPASSISQVTQGINQISSVVQTNSATAEESAAASEELAGQAQMLKSAVSKFTVREQAVN